MEIAAATIGTAQASAIYAIEASVTFPFLAGGADVAEIAAGTTGTAPASAIAAMGAHATSLTTSGTKQMVK